MTDPVPILAALLACGLGTAPAIAADTGRFTVTDQLAEQEVSENTEIYLDGRLVARFHLDRNTPARTTEISTDNPDDRHQYALCGEITVHAADARTETHEVNSGGFISDLDGRSFQALGAADFTFFYLADPAPGRAASLPVRGRSPYCHPPVS